MVYGGLVWLLIRTGTRAERALESKAYRDAVKGEAGLRPSLSEERADPEAPPPEAPDSEGPHKDDPDQA